MGAHHGDYGCSTVEGGEVRASRRLPFAAGRFVGCLGSTAAAFAAAVLCFASLGGVAWAQEPTGPVRAALALPDDSDRAAHAALVLPETFTRPEADVDLGALMDAQLGLLDELPPEAWELDALAGSLGPEPATAFEFVRDHVAFDPYPGVLRGADGALAARAGNAWDRALLLRALLGSHGHVTRLALGELDDRAVDSLLAASVRGAVAPLDPPDVASVSTFDVEELATRARRDYALLTGALSAAGVADALGRADGPGASRAGAVVPDLRAAVRAHAWVQLEQPDGSWLDLDASLPEAEPGVALTVASAYVDEVPDETLHRVVVRVLVETLADEELEESVSLEVPLTAVEAAAAELWLLFRPEQASGGVGLLGAVGGKDWQPVLLIDDEALVGTTFPLRGSGGGGGFGGFFGGGGGGEQVTRVRLQLVAESPDGTERTADRILLDRVDPERRAAGEVTAGSLTPLPSEGAPPELLAVHNVLFSNGGMSPREQVALRAGAIYSTNEFLIAEEAGSPSSERELLRALAVANRELVLTSERVTVAGLSFPGVRAFVGGARSFLVSVAPSADLEGGMASTIDLALDGVAFVGFSDGAAEARHRLWYGVLQGALETQASLRRWRGFEPTEVELDSVSLRMGEPLTVLPSSGVAEVTAAAVELNAALRSGEVVVSVGAPGPDGAFWAIEAYTGSTRSILEPGLRASRGRVGEWTKGPGYRPVKTFYIDDPPPTKKAPTPKKPVPANKCSGNEFLATVQCVAQSNIFKGTMFGAAMIGVVMFLMWVFD